MCPAPAGATPQRAMGYLLVHRAPDLRSVDALSGVEIAGPSGRRYEEILTPEALGLVATLHRELGARRRELLAARQVRARLVGGLLASYGAFLSALAFTY